VSSLSFIGLGVQPPAPEWGAMISEGRDFIRQAWWLATLPGLAIVVTGTALALIGGGLAQRLGERHHTAV
jgi:peptide/nickel transport system permease protein